MSMQKLSEIKRGGEYTAQRSIVEHLLLLEETILREIPIIKEIPTTRKILAQNIQQYRVQHHLDRPFNIPDIQHYLLSTAEQELTKEKETIRGMYTSALIERTEGDTPITIDMQGKKIDHLLLAINTPRHITLNNTNGNYTGADAGSYQGTAYLTINNTKGKWTGAYAGCSQGTAHLMINHTTGEGTGALAGKTNGKAIIVGYNNQGANQFFNHQGTIVNYNPNETPRIEGVTREQRTHIRTLIAQNISPEEIMAYLVKHT